MDGTTVYRVNEMGVRGIWRCKLHLTFDQEAAIDPEVKRITDIIEEDNRTNKKIESSDCGKNMATAEQVRVLKEALIFSKLRKHEGFDESGSHYSDNCPVCQKLDPALDLCNSILNQTTK